MHTREDGGTPLWGGIDVRRGAGSHALALRATVRERAVWKRILEGLVRLVV